MEAIRFSRCKNCGRSIYNRGTYNRWYHGNGKVGGFDICLPSYHYHGSPKATPDEDYNVGKILEKYECI